MHKNANAPGVDRGAARSCNRCDGTVLNFRASAARSLGDLHDRPRVMPAIRRISKTLVRRHGREEVVKWTLLLDGLGACTVTTHELQSFARFRRACQRQLGIELAAVPLPVWFDQLNAAMRPLREGRQ